MTAWKEVIQPIESVSHLYKNITADHYRVLAPQSFKFLTFKYLNIAIEFASGSASRPLPLTTYTMIFFSHFANVFHLKLVFLLRTIALCSLFLFFLYSCSPHRSVQLPGSHIGVNHRCQYLWMGSRPECQFNLKVENCRCWQPEVPKKCNCCS